MISITWDDVRFYLKREWKIFWFYYCRFFSQRFILFFFSYDNTLHNFDPFVLRLRGQNWISFETRAIRKFRLFLSIFPLVLFLLPGNFISIDSLGMISKDSRCPSFFFFWFARYCVKGKRVAFRCVTKGILRQELYGLIYTSRSFRDNNWRDYEIPNIIALKPI